MNAEEHPGRPEPAQATPIPRGIEVLLKKAAVDPKFRKTLLEKRAEAAKEIDLDLTDVERIMLANMPAEQLEKIIANTKVPPEHRSVFMGVAGKIMLALVAGTVIAAFCAPTLGHTLTLQQRERIRHMQEERARAIAEANDTNQPPRTDNPTPSGE